MRRIYTPLLVILSVVLSASAAFCQANVNEGLETASLYVDANSGSDSNPGTQQLPLKTIGAAASIAVSNNWAGIGTKVIINPGTYRESIAVGTSQYVTALPITFEAATDGTAIVSGADVWTGWMAYSGNSQIYTNSWPYRWGLCAPDSSGLLEQDIVLRREMIIVNGTPLTQVLSLNEVVAGTFYVDETQGTVYVWPPAGTNMASATVEVATRSGLFSDAGLSNLVLRGLTLQYDSSCRGSSAVNVFNSASNVLIDTDNFNWNNSVGLNLAQTTYVTVQNSVANHNGMMGMNAVKTKYGLWQNDQGSYDSWRGAQGDYLWGTGGIHFYQMHNDTITGSSAFYNQTHGLHYDTDNASITVESFTSSENLGTSLLLERSEGPISVSNSYFCNGKAPANSTIVNGVSVNNTEFVTLNGDVIYNGGNQITDAGVQGGIDVTNWETGQVYDLYTQNLTLTENTIEGVGSSQGVFQDAFGGTDWTNFRTTFVSDYNTWWNASNTTPFAIPGSPVVTNLDFTGWKSSMLTDAHSVWQAPAVDPSTACEATPDAPDFWLSASVGFLTVRPMTAAVFTATVTSLDFTGTVNLSSDGVQSIPGATASWSQDTITDSGTSTFTVNTSGATPAGNYPVVLMATSGSVTRTVTVSVIVDSNVSISPNSLSFPNQEVGTTSAAQNVTLTNTGSSTLSITSVAVTEAGQGDFAETNNCGTSLGAGRSCTISVTFSPVISGTFSPAIIITDLDPTSPQSVGLSGTGVAPIARVSPSSLTFAGQLINTASPAQVVTLTNTGTASLSITAININGPFSETNTCGETLGVGANCTVSVTFTPRSSGTSTGSLNFTNNGSPSFEQVTLSGTGLAGTPTVSPSSLTFASRQVNTTSPPLVVTLTNTGTASLNITAIDIFGNFSETNTCGASLAVGARCTASVTFTPKATGTLTGTLSFTTTGSPGFVAVTLSGTGTAAPTATLSTHSLGYGLQVVGITSAPQTATLTNAGTVTLNISSIAITGANASAFTETNNCGSSLAVGALCTFNVTFTPATTGSMSAVLTITDNTSTGSQTINLSGNGKSAVSLSRSSINFSSHKVGTTSGVQSITLTNLGNKLTIHTISITGTNPGDFAQTNTCGASVASGANCTISATFTPTATGSRSASVTISDSDPASPQSVSLSGTGS